MFAKIRSSLSSLLNRTADKVVETATRFVFGQPGESVEPPRIHGMTVPPATQTVVATPVVEAEVETPMAAPVADPAIKPAPVAVRPPFVVPERTCKCGAKFTPRTWHHKLCQKCSREAHGLPVPGAKAKPEPKVPPHVADERIRQGLVAAYHTGTLSKEVEVRKNGAQVILVTPVQRDGRSFKVSATFVDEKLAAQIAEERAAKARASAPARPKSPDQIQREKVAAAKVAANAARNAANAAKINAKATAEAYKTAEVAAQVEPVTDALVEAMLIAFDADQVAQTEADNLEAKAVAAEQKLAELTAPKPAEPKKSKKDKGDKEGKNGKGGRHARAN